MPSPEEVRAIHTGEQMVTAARNCGAAAGAFYQEAIGAGMDQHQAMFLTRCFVTEMLRMKQQQTTEGPADPAGA